MKNIKTMLLAFLSSIHLIKAEKILIESVSPKFGLIAIVEQTKNTTYLYLLKNSRSFLGALWIRNHKKPDCELNPMEIMNKGESPLLPSKFCHYPTSKPFFNINDLKIMWIDEIDESSNQVIGEHAVLLENEKVISIIPYWTSHDFSGFSIDCKEHSFLSSPLKEDNVLYQRSVLKCQRGK